MKISIWKQFSSNHSANYTVVGVFESAQQAQEARETIITIHEENANWYRDNNLYPRSLQNPSPIEEKYSKLYGFDWKEELDWAWYRPEKPIAHFDRLVIIDTSTVDTWQTGHQFVNLLSAMGANVYRYVTEGRDPKYPRDDWGHSGTYFSNFEYELHCITVNEKSANDFLITLSQVFNKERRYSNREPIEWLHFHPELSSYTIEQVQELESQYLSEFENSERVLSQEQRLLISGWRRDVSVYTSKETTFQQHENRVIINKLSVSDLAIGFQTFFLYLQSMGCEKVDYTFTQHVSYLYENGEYKKADD